MSVTRMLTLGPQLSLPIDAVTETFGILATRGAGKTNLARLLAESMYDAQLPFVAVDPVGSWWGLRASRDGTSSGLAIPIFGGKHGDVPLERNGGTLIADLVVDQRLTCVLDLTTFESEASKKQFLLDFARQLYQRNEQPLHLFLEEADDYIPQTLRSGGDERRIEPQLLRAWENIVRRGRARGLGMTMITQRSASLNKNVLEQVQTLFTLRTTGPRDRKAIAEWLKFHAQSDDVLASLPSLKAGDVWVWSPDFLHVMKRVHVPRSRTFDSGATPSARSTQTSPRAATLADVDLSALRTRMAATIERAKTSDPKALQQRVRELETQLRAKTLPASTELSASAVARVTALASAPFKRDLVALRRETAKLLAAVLAQLRHVHEQFAAGVSMLSASEGALATARDALRETATSSVFEPVASAPLETRRSAPATRVSADASSNGARVSTPQQSMLDALAWAESIRIPALGVGHLALLTKQMPSARGFQANVSALAGKLSLIERVGRDVRLTATGRARAATYDAPLALAQYHDALCDFLSGPQAQLLRTMLTAHPKSVSAEQLASRTEQDVERRGFQANVSALVGLKLVQRTDGTLSLTDLLFPPGLS